MQLKHALPKYNHFFSLKQQRQTFYIYQFKIMRIKYLHKLRCKKKDI